MFWFGLKIYILQKRYMAISVMQGEIQKNFWTSWSSLFDLGL